MPFATITSKGQITIPKSIRQQLALDSGDRILFAVDENGAVSFEPATKDYYRIEGHSAKTRKACLCQGYEISGKISSAGQGWASMKGLDTNVLLRYLARDDVEQTKFAARFLVC